MKKSNRVTIIVGIVILALLALLIVAGLVVGNKQATTGKTKQENSIETTKRPSESKAKLNQEALPQLTTTVAENESLVVMHTTQGDIQIKLFNKYAPLAVENFLTHAQENYYDNTTFHRVIKDFMIQGGDPKSAEDPNASDLGRGGKSIWSEGAHKDSKIDSGNGFKNEINNNLYNIKGSLAMANAGADTNGSQFFINQGSKDVTKQLSANKYPDKIIKTYKEGGNPSLDGSYTVFGQVIEGLDIVDKIASATVKTDDNGETSRPEDPVKIESIEVLQVAN